MVFKVVPQFFIFICGWVRYIEKLAA